MISFIVSVNVNDFLLLTPAVMMAKVLHTNIVITNLNYEQVSLMLKLISGCARELWWNSTIKTYVYASVSHMYSIY